MDGTSSIPEEARERNPLITRAGYAMLRRLQEHPHAPRWNHAAGDRLHEDDLSALNRFQSELAGGQRQDSSAVPEHILSWVDRRRGLVPSFARRLPQTEDLSRDWTEIPTMAREDIASSPELFVPDDSDLSDLIVYRTAGSTGHSLLVPHSARAAACYQPMLVAALGRHGVRTVFSSDLVACFLVCAQARTVTYPAVLSAWDQAGFAKVNLRVDDWPSEDSAQRYFRDLSPVFLTGDPMSFSEMLRMGINIKPAAMVSTAVAMSPSLKAKLALVYSCPVIEWYSLTETGPIGYVCRAEKGYHILPQDIFVECLDSTGAPVPAGQRGEITVTGGRNPFLPLLRYRTGDWGSLNFEPCACGDRAPRIEGLEGREPVIFRSASLTMVNPVDISGVLRDFPLVQHEFSQRQDLSIQATLRPIPGAFLDRSEVKAKLLELFGPLPIEVLTDLELGNRNPGGKTLPYRSDLLLED